MFCFSGNTCVVGGLTYENGVKIEHDCDSVCTCVNGKMNCTDRCAGPFFRKGKKVDDPLCEPKDTEDPCCSILVCAADTGCYSNKIISHLAFNVLIVATEPLEVCFYKNKTYNRSERIEDGCESLCTCEHSGKVSCKPR